MSESAGTVNYGVQIVQAGMPMEKGTKYKLAYDAYADKAGTIQTSRRGLDGILWRADGGTKISDRHSVVLDNITLEETEPQS